MQQIVDRYRDDGDPRLRTLVTKALVRQGQGLDCGDAKKTLEAQQQLIDLAAVDRRTGDGPLQPHASLAASLRGDTADYSATSRAIPARASGLVGVSHDSDGNSAQRPDVVAVFGRPLDAVVR